MQAQFQAALRRYLSVNTDQRTGRPFEYGIDVTRVQEAGNGVEVVIDFRFLSGREYCCAEPGCHTGFFRRKAFARLRGLLADHEINPGPLLLIFEVTVEAGVRSRSMEQITGQFTTAGYTYREEYREQEGK